MKSLMMLIALLTLNGCANLIPGFMQLTDEAIIEEAEGVEQGMKQKSM